MTVAIVAATFGGAIGVVMTITACICVWCFTRHARTKMRNRKNQRELDSRKEQQQQELESTNVSNELSISMQQNAAYKGIPGNRDLSPKPPVTASSVQSQVDLAYELHNKICNLRGTGDEEESEEDGYERMYAAENNARMFGHSPRRHERGSNVHVALVPRGYELPIQQRESNDYVDDNENAYDYII